MSRVPWFVAVTGIALAVAVTLEVLLFRIFARGGVYFIKEDTPGAVKTAYTSLVYLGNAMFNFAAPVVLLLLAFLSWHLWRAGRGAAPRVAAVAVSGVVLISALKIADFQSQGLSHSYLAASAVAIIGVVVIVARGGLSIPMRLFVAAASASYLSLYAFKTLGGLAGTGSIRSVDTVSWFTAGEWTAAAGFLALALALPKVADRASVGIGVFVTLLALGMTVERADSIPLIAVWAFGLSLSLPYVVYALALGVVVAFVIGSFRRGQPLLGAGVLLLFMGHRTIPLTYFNDLAIAGLLMATLGALGHGSTQVAVPDVENATPEAGEALA
ncbi:MAG: hypothetical protein ACOC5K_03585 [Chloroflexota bacterium]